MTYSLRRKMSSRGLVFAWYSRSRTASASSVSSSRLISSPPQASHFPCTFHRKMSPTAMCSRSNSSASSFA